MKNQEAKIISFLLCARWSNCPRVAPGTQSKLSQSTAGQGSSASLCHWPVHWHSQRSKWLLDSWKHVVYACMWWLMTNRAETLYNEAVSLPREHLPVSTPTHCWRCIFPICFKNLWSAPFSSAEHQCTPPIHMLASVVPGLQLGLKSSIHFYITGPSYLIGLSAVLWSLLTCPGFVPYLMLSYCIPGPRSRQRVWCVFRQAT